LNIPEIDVTIDYRNAQREIVTTKVYSFKDYTEMLRIDLLRLISDVEDLVYLVNHNQSKEDWPDDVWNAFMGVKHKLLDKANDIGRLPDTISVSDPEGGRVDGKGQLETPQGIKG